MRFELMKVFSIVLVFLAFACAETTPADLKTTAQTEAGSIIPEKIKRYIESNLKGWSIPSESDYVKAWWSFYDRSEIPYFVTADFNDDARSDYAFLLKNDKALALAFITSRGDSLQHWFAPDFARPFHEKNIEYGLAVEPPAQIDVAYPEIKSLILKSNGITLRHFEVNDRIYYWEKGSYQVFTMGKN